jgi:Tol biopolymer transport system component
LTRKKGSKSLDLPTRAYNSPRISPDGKRIAFGIDEGRESSVWIYELSSSTAPRRLTFGGRNRYPIWSGDGQHLAFQSDREGDLGIFWQRADGTGTVERITKPGTGVIHIPDSWSPDGERFSFTAVKGTEAVVWIHSIKDKKETPFAATPSAFIGRSVFSPDGRWIAYQSNEAGGRNRVFVQPFPPNGAKYEIGGDRSINPLWSPDGNQLFYIGNRNDLFAVSVSTPQAFTFTKPVPIPVAGIDALPMIVRNHDVLPNGRAFIAVANTELTAQSTPVSQIVVVLNWFEELKQRVPVH